MLRLKAANWPEYRLLMRMDKPIGTLLLLWPTLWAVWLASGGWPEPLLLGVFVVGTFLMRSAGCVINDYADRDIDPHVERTRERPLAAGRVSSREALELFGALALLAGLLVLTQNALTIALSVVGVLLAASYPFMKRFHHLPQLHLGIAFGWAIPMAFAAAQGEVPALAWWLFAAKTAWTVAYDTMYAMVDRDDDLKIGVKSTAVLFGDQDRLMIGLLQLLALAGMGVVGVEAGLGLAYWLGLAVATGLGLYQQWLIRHRERMPCFRAFLNNNWLGLVVLIGLVADGVLR